MRQKLLNVIQIYPLTILIACFFLSNLKNCIAQKEGNFWYFGWQAGIDFNSGIAVPVTDGNISVFEGCATISDEFGGLLFYTDGESVWNKNHSKMPNGTGLKGNGSTSNSSIILKDPRATSIYYLFTVDAEGGPDGLRYSQVDMNLQGGLGDINNLKNIPIVPYTAEKICIIKHRNNRDFWIITRLFDGSNTYHSYLLTNTGINLTPIISKVGTIIPLSNFRGTQGCIKASPDGTKIAAANFRIDNFDIFDFDPATGILSNSITSRGQRLPYGAEFSPNSNLLYISTRPGLFQYNLKAGSGSATDILNSKVVIKSEKHNEALQLGPDQKIYHANHGSSRLNVINNPNRIGLACNYASAPFSLNGKQSFMGLPASVNSTYSVTSFTFSNLCFSDSTYFNIENSSYVDSVRWNFGDTASGIIANSSNLFHPSHLFSDTGIFNVSLISYSGSKIDTITQLVRIDPLLSINLGSDTSTCLGDTLSLSLSLSGATYLWQDNSTDSTIRAFQSGIYWVTVTKNNCSSTDTINLNFNDSLTFDLGNDTTLCPKNTLTLNTEISNATYLWSDNSTQQTLRISQSGNYWLTAMIGNCKGQDSINVDFYSPSPINLGNDTTIELGQAVNLSTKQNNGIHNWSPSTWLDCSNCNPVIARPQETITYSVIAIDSNGCSATDDIRIIVDSEYFVWLPNIFSPNGDGNNDVLFVRGFGIKSLEFSIYNRWGEKVFETSSLDVGWDGTFKEHNSNSAVFVYSLLVIFEDGSKRKLKGNVTLVR